jgi:thiamine kinase-like enzyme
LSNHNFLVSAAQRRFVIRIDGVIPHRHGLNRQAEFAALQSAASAGIAPFPRYFNPELGALVSDYIAPDPEQTLESKELASLCRRIHALPARRHRLDLPGRIRRYETLLQRADKQLPPITVRTAIEALSEKSADLDAPAVLSHNDLLPANLIRSAGKLYAIDWEYCAMGNPWFDLAVVCAGQSYTGDKSNRFLEHYLQRKVTEGDREKLQSHSAIYRYIELLWHLTEKNPDEAASELQFRLPAVERELR